MRLEDPLTGALIKLFVFGEGCRSKDYRPRERRGSLTILEQTGSSKTKSKTKKKKRTGMRGWSDFCGICFCDGKLTTCHYHSNGRRHTTFEARRIELKGFWNHHVLLLGRIFPRCNCWYCDLPLDSESSAEAK